MKPAVYFLWGAMTSSAWWLSYAVNEGFFVVAALSSAGALILFVAWLVYNWEEL